MALSENAAFLLWLQANGFQSPRALTDEVWAAVKPFVYTFAIVIGEIGDESCYLDRWCYSSQADALAALEAWDGVGEPTGWHRHPLSGRRVSTDANTIDDSGKRVAVGQMYHHF